MIKLKLIILLKWAHAVEMGAYQAYEGHWRSLPYGSQSQNNIKAIQADEKDHKETLELMLEAIGSGPSFFLDALVWCIGRAISISCRFMSARRAMWGAKIMETMGADLYKKIAKIARQGNYLGMALELDCMQSAEEDHEIFLKTYLAPSRGSDPQSQNSTCM